MSTTCSKPAITSSTPTRPNEPQQSAKPSATNSTPGEPGTAKKRSSTTPSTSYPNPPTAAWIGQLGDIAGGRGRIPEAARFYQQSLTIAERLAALDPDNTDYQRDLSISCNKLGDLARAAGQVSEAARFYQQSLTIAERLAALDPDNTDYQRDLSVSYERLAVLAEKTDPEKALRWVSKAVTLRLALHEAQPTQADLAVELAYTWYLRSLLGGGDGSERDSISAVLTPFAETNRLDSRGVALLTWANSTEDAANPDDAPTEP
jgi:tetratricopeptide (TPR) repeat protein